MTNRGTLRFGRTARASVAGAIVLALTACGHSRPPASERLAMPLVPAVLPAGYELGDIGERSATGGGRWIDLSYVPLGAAPHDASRVVSLHQFLDLEADTTSPGPGRPFRVRGHLASCGADGILRWNESRTAHLSIGGGGLTCEELQRVADSLQEVDAAGWREYERTVSDG